MAQLIAQEWDAEYTVSAVALRSYAACLFYENNLTVND